MDLFTVHSPPLNANPVTVPGGFELSGFLVVHGLSGVLDQEAAPKSVTQVYDGFETLMVLKS